jgi:hypothetical protein
MSEHDAARVDEGSKTSAHDHGTLPTAARVLTGIQRTRPTRCLNASNCPVPGGPGRVLGRGPFSRRALHGLIWATAARPQHCGQQARSCEVYGLSRVGTTQRHPEARKALRPPGIEQPPRGDGLSLTAASMSTRCCGHCFLAVHRRDRLRRRVPAGAPSTTRCAGLVHCP